MQTPKQRFGIAIAFVVGAMLSVCFQKAQPSPFGYSGHDFWGWPVYQAALLLAALGFAALFPSVWVRTAVAVALGAILSELVPDAARALNEPFHDTSPPPIAIVVVLEAPVLCFFTFPAALLGGAAGWRLSRSRAPRPLYVLLLPAALVMTGTLPIVDQNARRRIENDELPPLLRRIHSAEMAYHDNAPDHRFSCDPAALGPIRDLAWRTYPRVENELVPQRWVASLPITGRYAVNLDCGEIGLRYEANAIRIGSPAMVMSIDPSGELLRNTINEALYRKRIETQELPALLQLIYKAEMDYSATQPDKTFSCQGVQLPRLQKLRWDSPNILRVDSSSAVLDCQGQERARTFRITVEYGVPPLFKMSMNESGRIEGR